MEDIKPKRKYNKQYSKKYYEEKKEKILEATKKWKKENRQRCVFNCQVYNEKKKKLKLKSRVDYVDDGDLIFANYFG